MPVMLLQSILLHNYCPPITLYLPKMTLTHRHGHINSRDSLSQGYNIFYAKFDIDRCPRDLHRLAFCNGRSVLSRLEHLPLACYALLLELRNDDLCYCLEMVSSERQYRWPGA